MTARNIAIAGLVLAVLSVILDLGQFARGQVVIRTRS